MQFCHEFWKCQLLWAISLVLSERLTGQQWSHIKVRDKHTINSVKFHPSTSSNDPLGLTLIARFMIIRQLLYLAFHWSYSSGITHIALKEYHKCMEGGGQQGQVTSHGTRQALVDTGKPFLRVNTHQTAPPGVIIHLPPAIVVQK